MPGNVNFSAAYWGFAEMGFECVLFRSIEELDASSRDDVVVGGLGPVRHALVSRGVRIEEFDYPDELRGYMGRRNMVFHHGRSGCRLLDAAGVREAC